jgi:antitoxin component YwqK of YwqJK toxin-antitoxin module
MKNIVVKILCILFLSNFFACNQKEEAKNISEENDTDTTVVSKSLKKLIPQGEYTYEADFYESGQMKYEGNWKEENKSGKWSSFYENGNPWSETHYNNGVKDGKTTSWYSNGVKRFEGFYKNDKRFGKWTFWDEEGNLVQEENFE